MQGGRELVARRVYNYSPKAVALNGIPPRGELQLGSILDTMIY